MNAAPNGPGSLRPKTNDDGVDTAGVKLPNATPNPVVELEKTGAAPLDAAASGALPNRAVDPSEEGGRYWADASPEL